MAYFSYKKVNESFIYEKKPPLKPVILNAVKRYFDVEHHFSKDLQCIYFTGRKTKSSNVTLFVPIAASANISLQQMENYLTLSHSDQQQNVVLSIVDSDSTCVYYEITKGIKDPTPEIPPVDVEEKRTKLDVELRKNIKLLQESAMYGIPIALPMKKQQKMEDEGSE